MSYRKFKLVNSLNQTYELTDQNYKQFLSSPRGLGYDKDLEGIRVGNRYKVTKREYEFPTPSGELIFYDEFNEDKYDKYKNFVQFASHYPLKLYYYTPTRDQSEEEANSIYLVCEVKTLDKSEVSYDSGLFRVPVAFQGFTFWLNGTESVLHVDNQNTDDSEFTFPLSFPFSFGSDPFRSIVIPNNGSLITPVSYTITGRCINPYIRFFERKGNDYVEYGASKFVGTFDSVYVNAEDNNQEIILKYNNNIISNPAEKQDLTLANVDDPDNEYFLTFLKVRPGSTYVTVTFGNDFKGTIDFKWRDEYVSN